MKQNIKTIKLSQLAGDKEFLSGNDLGRKVFQLLQIEIEKSIENQIFCISLKGIKATDASFPRESVVSLVKMLSGEVGIFLKDFASQDLIDNWNYAALAKNQNIIVYRDDGYKVIGPELSESNIELLSFIISQGTTTTSKVSSKFDLSAQNASAKLKKLHSLGLVLSKKAVAESGGVEYIYQAIK